MVGDSNRMQPFKKTHISDNSTLTSCDVMSTPTLSHKKKKNIADKWKKLKNGSHLEIGMGWNVASNHDGCHEILSNMKPSGEIQLWMQNVDKESCIGEYSGCVKSNVLCSENCNCRMDTEYVMDEGAETMSTSLPDTDQYVALDCEFVGVGQKRTSALARCSIIDYSGHVLLDLYVKPEEHITDYRTPWSGIRPNDMKRAVPFKNARNMIIKAIKNKIVVGHALHNDFRALKYFHPAHSVRDTSTHKLLKRMAKCSKSRAVSLKHLTQQLCGYEIQRGEHCSIEDSRAAMSLFKLVRVKWEKMLLMQKSEADSQEGKCIRSVSESSDEHYFSDNLWPTDL